MAFAKIPGREPTKEEQEQADNIDSTNKDKAFVHIQTGRIQTWEDWVKQSGLFFVSSWFTLGILKEVPMILTKDPATLTEEERAQYNIFFPLTVPVEPITLEKVVLGLVLVKYMKTPEGMKQLADIVTKYLDVVGKTMSALSAAGASHPLASLIHGRITISVYETLGLIQPKMARVMHSNFEDNINKIIAKDYLKDIIGGIGQIIPG